MAGMTGKLTPWQLQLSELEFDGVHRAAKKYQVSNALVRLTSFGTDNTVQSNKIAELRVPAIVIVEENNDE